VNGIGRESATDSIAATRQSSGMGFRVGAGAGDFLKDNGDYLTCGINCPITPAISTSNLPATVIQRWLNDWYINKTDINSNNGLVTLYFDFGDYGIGNSPGVPSNYVLLYRNSPSATFSIVPGTTPSVSSDQVRFAVDASNITTNFYYTIGTLDPTTSPLPIELLNFSGNCNGNNTHLKWSTASEINNDYFTIERSIDAISYELLGKVDGAGNSVQTLNYSFVDPTPIEGTGYYRLKQTDFDGKYKYSKIISVKCIKIRSEKIIVYPNPASYNVTIELLGNSRTLPFEIINSKGQVIYSGTITNKINLPNNGLISGLYFVKVTTESEVLTEKIVIEK
jgi:hypothetical protein